MNYLRRSLASEHHGCGSVILPREISRWKHEEAANLKFLTDITRYTVREGLPALGTSVGSERRWDHLPHAVKNAVPRSRQ